MKRPILLMLLLTCGCAKLFDRRPMEVTLHGVTYDIPRGDVEAAALTPPGMLFVRARPQQGDLILILDALVPHVPNEQGPDIPTISRLNDNRFREFDVLRVPGGPVICGDRHCGISVDDGPVRWGVLFARGKENLAPLIRKKAEALIRGYRSDDSLI